MQIRHDENTTATTPDEAHVAEGGEATEATEAMEFSRVLRRPGLPVKIASACAEYESAGDVLGVAFLLMRWSDVTRHALQFWVQRLAGASS